MKITFRTEHIIPELRGENAFQVIGELVEHLVSVGTVLSETAEPISLAVKQRETSMSTGIGFGIAIPHASTSLTDEIILAPPWAKSSPSDAWK
jgi:mannitol/fructose-specific phosphotransferase system IIA component (Ntr-type)